MSCPFLNTDENDSGLAGKTFFIDGEIYIFKSEEVVINLKPYQYTADGATLRIPDLNIAYPYSISGDTLTITTKNGLTVTDCLPYDDVSKKIKLTNVPVDGTYSVAVGVVFAYEGEWYYADIAGDHKCVIKKGQGQASLRWYGTGDYIVFLQNNLTSDVFVTDETVSITAAVTEVDYTAFEWIPLRTGHNEDTAELAGEWIDENVSVVLTETTYTFYVEGQTKYTGIYTAARDPDSQLRIITFYVSSPGGTGIVTAWYSADRVSTELTTLALEHRTGSLLSSIGLDRVFNNAGISFGDGSPDGAWQNGDASLIINFGTWEDGIFSYTFARTENGEVVEGMVSGTYSTIGTRTRLERTHISTDGGKNWDRVPAEEAKSWVLFYDDCLILGNTIFTRLD
ncbi:MAG: hypothetical protein FWG46_04165 [Treponema sp.]|nr:hypothetical protein [Treponema sp.]